MYLLAKYNVQTDIYFPMVKRGVVDLAVTADWTPATGDTKVSKDGGAVANTTNNPAIASGTSWKLTLTATELSAKWITVQIVDSATKAVEDQFITILTYGNASAFFIAPDYQDSVRFGLTALPNAAAEAAGGLYTRGAGAGQINQNANGQVDTRWVAGNVTVGTNSDKTGYTLTTFVESGTAQAGAAGSITLRSGAVATDSFYSDQVVVLTGGTGSGQARLISGYTGSSKVATVVPNWQTNPDATSTYVLVALGRADVAEWLGTAVTAGTAGVPDVNAARLGGTTQTGRDVGASVLLSAGTGTGQLDFTSGVVKANLAQILGTALTETAGQIAAGFKQFFNIASPTSTMNTITTVTTATNLTTNNDKTGYALTSGEHTNIAADVLDATASAHNTAGTIGAKINSAGSAADPWATAVPGSYGAGTAGKILGTNLDTTVSSRSSHSAADVWASATRTLTSFGTLVSDVWANATRTLSGSVTVDMTQAVPTTNTAQTVGDALNAARAQGFGKWVLSGTTLTLYANDGTTAIKTFTLDSATAPTSRT